MPSLTRTQKRNRKKKAERRKKASETRRRQASASRKIQTAFRDYNQLDKCGICLLGVRPELQEYCHNFHPECVARWKASASANRHLCPSCRQPLLSTRSQQPTLSTRLVLLLARDIQSKVDDLTVLIDHISRLEPYYFEDVPELDAVLQRVMIQSNTILASVADGTLDADPEMANYYLSQGASHLNQMNDLIDRLEADREGLQEVADIRATH